MNYWVTCLECSDTRLPSRAGDLVQEQDTLREATTLQPDLRGHIWCSCANISLFPEEVQFYLYKHLSAVLKAAKKRLVHKLLYTLGTVLSNHWRRWCRPIKKMVVLLLLTGGQGKGHFETCFII